MHLTHLSLTNFRNFARLDIELPKGAIVLMGANAQGKTSLLEAIYYAATQTAFHAENDRQLINFHCKGDDLAVSRIVAEFEREGKKNRLEIRLILEKDKPTQSERLRKEIYYNGVKHKVNEVLGQFNAVLFLPQMMSVVDGAPETRRRYLNLALMQTIGHYGAWLTHYTKSLSQRNALLKMIAERGGDAGQLTYWDEQLAESGAHIIQARIQAVQELERAARPIHEELTRGGEILRLEYLPAYEPLNLPQNQLAFPMDAQINRAGITIEEIQAGFLERLSRNRGEEIARGVTTCGPHRDDLSILTNGIELGKYGSRGQNRTAMLALKLAEVAWMQQKTRQWPVLLLDEVLAELDIVRREDLLTRLSGGEQNLLTTTDLNLFAINYIQTATLWRVVEGRVEDYG